MWKQRFKELQCLLSGGHDYRWQHVVLPPKGDRRTFVRKIVCKCSKCGKLKPSGDNK